LEIKEIYMERLRKLADSDFEEIIKTTPRKRFDFRCVNYSETANHVEGCGSAGCLMGEFPLIFPENWEFVSGDVKFIGDSSGNSNDDGAIVDDDVCSFFGLDDAQYRHLFFPNRQIPVHYGGRVLRSFSTRKEVIDNLKIFIENVEKGIIKIGN
jgi:hypothetical protein